VEREPEELEREEFDREELERELPDRERPLELDRLVERERPLDRELPLDRDELLEPRERVRLEERRRRVVVARSDLGTSARTTSLTRRPSSASRNFAIRSSSRLIDFASCAVSRSPTVSANVWMRE
jgi:hypothetical protein